MVETVLLVVVVQACMFSTFGIGYLIGRKTSKPESQPAPVVQPQSADKQELTQAEKNRLKFMEEQTEAFHMLMNYNADNAYGVVPMSLEGGERI